MTTWNYLGMFLALLMFGSLYSPALYAAAVKLAAWAKGLFAAGSTGGTITAPAAGTTATITVEQALAAELLLQRFKGQDATKDAGAKLVLKGIQTLAETTP